MNCLFRVESGVDLAKTIQQKTNEQVETTDKIVQNAFKRHEQNLIDNLKQSEYSIKSVIASHEEAIKDRLNKLSTYTTMMGVIFGILIILFIILALANFWAIRKLNITLNEQAQIQARIDQSPIQAKITMHNEFLNNYTSLLDELEQQLNELTNSTTAQNKLIERLTIENQTYKEHLESLTAKLQHITNNTAKQEAQFTALITRLNSENSKLAKQNKQPNRF
ncbi:hypothetical protein AAX05_09325 [Moraxella bovoculi]|uniref:Uncharacterized protein n=1 Tax=Moraxella bovoculi TaxID=386891 RepID=A0AAC8TAA9_9GAMM|nr:MbeB family mobilization protein [Moraxella bovoculi]AKG08451.1 hypothetical protein AAX06_10230 [Moraxella bovoculi]AKG10300.1 hypothetical protein AAX05_09325 [Moraxella bovoculi]AKG12313.1 hypothetical protein AAX07_10475 [Moraxella bovoculi]AKG14286.1 hypothetical protein AAX11_10010 [Moraxella bovoculi]